MEDAAGKTAAEYVWAYPPGVPLLAPGEEVTPRLPGSGRDPGRRRHRFAPHRRRKRPKPGRAGLSAAALRQGNGCTSRAKMLQ